MSVTNLHEYKQDKKKYSKHDQEYASAKMKLSKWTVVHEFEGNKFSLDEMSMAIYIQLAKHDGPRCKQDCCRLWAIKDDECYLHRLLTTGVKNR